MKRLITALFAMGLAASAAAQDGAPTDRDAAKAAVVAAFEAARQQAGDGDHLLIRPGVIADRKAKTVKLFGWATEMESAEPVEFFAIHEASGKDYESLAVVTAKPSDVRAAIEFIGMTPGETTNYQQLRFWPKGERMTLAMHWQADGGAQSANASDLVMDIQADQSLPDTGLTFTGSFFYVDDAGEKRFAGDTLDTRGVAATYNDAESLLTVPWQARQGDVYGQYVPNAARRIPAFAPVTLTLTPKDPGRQRVKNLTLSIMPTDGERLAFTLAEPEGEALVSDAALPALTAAVAELHERGRDPFVTVLFSDDLPIAHVMQASALIGTIDTFNGIRVEPPAKGHLFYRAFTPDPRWRDRDQRVFHGWEVHLTGPVDRPPTITLYDVTDGRDAEGLLVINAEKHAPETPKAMARIIEDADGDRPRDVYVYVKGERTYGDLRVVLADLIDTHNIVFVYLQR